MNSPTTASAAAAFSMSSHQAIMKCPWQWRQPFLDEKRASRKRKVGDGYFYDPVDPSFVDHLLPGHAKKFCAELLESDEKEQIQLEIERLRLQKEERAARLIYEALLFGIGGASAESAGSKAGAAASADGDKDGGAASEENLALVDSILLMTKSVDDSSLLASPKSVSSPLSPLLDDEDDEHALSLGDSSSASTSTAASTAASSNGDCGSASEAEDASSGDEAPFAVASSSTASSLELVSDNLQDDYFASEDSALLDFPTSPVET